MGGMIAQEMAIRFPDRVRGLVLGCTSHGGPRAVLPSPKVAAALGARGAPADLRVQLVGRALFSEQFRTREPALVAPLPRAARRAPHVGPRPGEPPDGLDLPRHAGPARPDRRSDAGASTATATRSPRPRTPACSPTAIPDATLALVPGAGHGYLLEQPELSHRLFVDWLRSRSPVRAGPPLSGLAARSEPFTRHLGLPVGMLRTARSLTTPPSPPVARR